MKFLFASIFIIIASATVTFAAEDTSEKKSVLDFINSLDLEEPAPKPAPTTTDQNILRRHFEGNLGLQLNKPGGKWHPLIQETHTYLNEIINDLNKNNSRQSDFHWIIEIRESGEPVAAAEYFGPSEDQKGFEKATYENLKLAYGISDGKPLAVIHVSTAMLKLVKTRSQLAFILGHEMKHHTEGHTKAADSLLAQIHSQPNEAVADKGSLDFMKGRFNLDAGYSAMSELLGYQSKDVVTIEEQISQIEDSVTAAHHHAGLRLTFLLHSIIGILDTDSSLREVRDEPIPNIFAEVVKTFPGRMPRSTKRDLVRLLKDVKKIPSEELFQMENIDRFGTFFYKFNKDFFKYKDSSEIFSKFLKYLAKQPDADKSARIAFLFLMSSDEFQTSNFLEKIDGQLSNQLFDLLTKVSNDGITKEKVWQGKEHYRPPMADWQPKIKRSKYLTSLLSQLAQKSDAWNRTQKDIQDTYAKSQKFSIHIDTSTDWDLRSALSSLAWLETATDEQLRDGSAIMQIPETVASIKDPKNKPKLGAQFGQERLEKLIKKLEAPILEQYVSAKNALQAAKDPRWDPITFGSAWMRLNGLGLKVVEDDKTFFLQQILRSSMEDLWQNAILSKKNLPKTLADLYRFASTSQSFNLQERIQIFVRLAAIADSGRPFVNLFRQDADFRQRTLDTLNRNTIHDLLMADGLQIRGKGLSAKVAILDELHFHGLLDSYLSSAQSRNDFNLFLQNGDQFLKEKAGKKRNEYDGFLPSGRDAKFILMWLQEVLKGKSESDKESRDLVLRTLRIISTRYDISPEEQKLLSKPLLAMLENLKGSEKLDTIKSLEVRRSLSKSDLTLQLSDGIIGGIKEGRQMTDIWAELSKSLDFKGAGRDLALDLRNVVAQKTQVQPNAPNKTLPIPESSETERAQNFTATIRLWSGFTSMIQAQAFEDQLEAIDYFLGRSTKVPKFIYKLEGKNRVESLNVVEQSAKLRTQLAEQNDYIRSTFVNSLLVGPQAKVMRSEYREKLLEYLLTRVNGPNRAVAHDVMTSLIEAEGVRASTLLSQVFASKTLDEATMIRICLGNYFVPGMKFGQYLAFVSEFKAFEKTFADFQDAAPVPGYYEIMTLIYKELHDKIDLGKINVLGLLGAGTVNMAVEYLDLTDNKIKVINISREKIAQRTEADFARFKEFVRVLATKSSKEHDYNFVVGLTGLIERSIKLEFDRQAAFKRQEDAMKIYTGDYLGEWKLQTVTADGLYGNTILMGKAPGITAKKLWERNPELYKNLMSRLYSFEYGRIFGALQKGQIRLANPDLHDGQVLIDEKSKTLTVIDFGQALPINESQKNLALEILSMVAGLKSNSASLSLLNEWLKSRNSPLVITQDEIQNLISHQDPMDRFMRLISLMNLKKGELPLESIQLVLQINRLAKLGEKTGRHPKLTMGLRLIGRELSSKLGLRSSPVTRSCHSLFGP